MIVHLFEQSDIDIDIYLQFEKAKSVLWWRIAGSNRWPPECKSGALPAELIPPKKMVGRGRLERPTSPLSGVRSNHLSYRPLA